MTQKLQTGLSKTLIVLAKTQKMILKAFGIDNSYVGKKAVESGEVITKNDDEKGTENNGEARKNLSIEEEIERQEAAVEKSKAKYDADVERLKIYLQNRMKSKRRNLWTR